MKNSKNTDAKKPHKKYVLVLKKKNEPDMVMWGLEYESKSKGQAVADYINSLLGDNDSNRRLYS